MPHPSTPTVGPPASTAPSCAAASTPSASPLTTHTPRSESASPRALAVSMPVVDAFRDQALLHQARVEGPLHLLESARSPLGDLRPPRQLGHGRPQNGLRGEVTEVRDEAAPDPGLQEREEQIHCPFVIFQLGATSGS